MRPLACLLLSACLTACSLAETLLDLPNSGFEQGATGWIIPAGEAFTTIAAAPGGGQALRVADQDLNGGSNATSARVPVTQPGSYAVRGRYYPVAGTGVGLYLRYYTGDKLLAGLQQTWNFGGEQQAWQPFEYSFLVPPSVTALELWVHSYTAAQVEGWFDDLQLVQVNVLEGDVTDDMVLIKERLTAEVLAGTPNEAAAATLRDGVRDGQFPEVNYTDNDATNWAPAGHISRLFTMAMALGHPQSKLKDDPGLEAAFYAAFDWWTAHNPQCPNWWYNRIGVPLTFYRVMLLVDPRLSPERHEAGVKILDQAALGMTGQNLVWVAQISVARGCIAGRAWEVMAAFDAMAREVKITGDEGIQPDFSFYQHGTQFYSGGYGRGFAVDTPHFAALAAGTAFALKPDKVAIMEGYLLDGQQWMTRGTRMDFSACGREISRRGAGRAGGYAAACRYLLQLDPPRPQQLEAFAKRLEEPALKATEPLVGNRVFWRVDYMAHHRPGFMASVRMTSKRLLQTEVTNQENLLGKHLSDGLTYIYRDGEEYEGIFGVWDWQKLPGTTVAQDGDARTKGGARGELDFAGGVSDGMHGLAAMDFRRGPLTARKSWLMVDAGFLAAGSGITSTGDAPVVTTLNQSLLRSEVNWQDAAGRHSAKTASQDLSDVRWLHHDATGYLFFEPTKVHLEAGERTGNWRRISIAQRDAEVTAAVFSVWIDHGVKPRNASYAYLVLPGVSVDELVALAAQPLAAVVGNTAAAQVLASGKLIAAACYQAGTVDTPLGKLTVDRPCLVLAQETEEGLEVSAADAAHGTAPITVTIGALKQTFTLPDGLHAGETVTAVLR